MPVRVDEQVRRLDVAVHEAGAVDRVQRGAGLRDDIGRLGRVERAAAADERAQVVAGDEAHRDVGDAVVLARRVHRDHVRMLDARRGARLAQEPLADVVVVEQLRRDHLQRDDPLELELDRAVDHAHPAATDQRLDPVAGHHRAGRELPHRALYIRTASRHRAISGPVTLNRSAAVRMPRRGPEQAPLRDPPPDGRHLLPAARPWPAGPLGA